MMPAVTSGDQRLDTVITLLQRVVELLDGVASRLPPSPCPHADQVDLREPLPLGKKKK